LRRLSRRRSSRREAGAFVLEGPNLVEEALDAGADLRVVYAPVGTDHPVLDRAAAAGVPVRRLAPGVLERVADAATPQPVLALAGLVDVALEEVDADLVVVVVDLRDPGNAGTILRSARAAGAGAVVVCGDSVDLHGPKAARASAGALFHIPVVEGGDPIEVLGRLGAVGLRRLAAVATGGPAHDAVDLTGPVALVLGNESAGLAPEVVAACDAPVTIPMAAGTESLNVAVTAAVLCFEAARQRRVAAGG
jgi:TrmH family RNA methyltransferase